jgi:hypothetical protein
MPARAASEMRSRAFAQFAARYGTEKLMDCLEANENAGNIYHYPDQLDGDYDSPQTERKSYR